MSDFSLKRKLDSVVTLFPELSEKRQEVEEILTSESFKSVDVVHGQLIPAPPRLGLKYISVNVGGDIYTRNGMVTLSFVNGISRLTKDQRIFLEFFGFYLEQRRRSYLLIGTQVNFSRLSEVQKYPKLYLLRKDKDLEYVDLYPADIERWFFSIDLKQKRIPEIIAEIVAQTQNPKILSAIEDYQRWIRLNELEEIRENLEDLDAEYNLPAIVLHNILDEGQLKLNRERRFHLEEI